MRLFSPATLLLVVGVVLLTGGRARGQKNEVGGSLGTVFYTGDMARTWVPANSGVAGMIFLRTFINDHLSLRAAYMGGNLKGSDTAKPVDAFAVARSASFSYFVSEFTGSFEYYFLDFRSKRTRLKFSPYFHGGLGIFAMIGVKERSTTYSTVQVAVPLGIGLTYRPNKLWSVGLEFGTRVLFFDYLDNVSEGDVFNKNYQYGNKYDNDNYHYIGITLSRTLYKIYCPTLPLQKGYRR